MKKGEGYDLDRNKQVEKITFAFKSVSEQRTINKIIEFKKVSTLTWNLGFGDEKGEDWEDNVISNNNDLRKVLQTVVNAIYEFLNVYPNTSILIFPLDYQRKLLYNRIFQIRWHEIEPFFMVNGFISDDSGVSEEEYNPKKVFDYFVIKPK
jgi:hypothetical protein